MHYLLEKEIVMSWARKSLFSLASIVATMALAICANAATWYVDPGGNDTTGDGMSLASAFATIQHAIDVSSNGDTVLVTATYVSSNGIVSSEVYNESIDFKGKQITVDGGGGSPFGGPDLVAEL